MSLRQTLSLAHTAQCKLHIAANRPDRNLRFMLGHALTLDSLTLRLVEIEEEDAVVQRPGHASGVKFKAAGNGGAARRRSPPPPPPPRWSHDVGRDDEEGDGDEAGSSGEEEEDDLALMRYPSGSGRASQPPPLVPSDDGDDDDEDEDPPSPPPPSEDELRKVVKGGSGDELLVSLYRSIKGCPCHGQTDAAPEVQQIWEIPGQGGKVGPRVAVAEIVPPAAA